MVMPRFLALLEIKSKFCVARSTSYTDAPPDQIVFTVLTPSTKFHSLAVSQMEASYGLFGTHCVMVTLLYSAKFVYVGAFMTNEHWATVASFEVTTCGGAFQFNRQLQCSETNRSLFYRHE